MIFVVDYDGTLVEEIWPRGDKPRWIPGALDAVRALLDSGHDVIVSSCRNNPAVAPEGDWQDMLNELERVGLSGRVHVDDGKHGKPYGDVYVDDRALSLGSRLVVGSTWYRVREMFATFEGGGIHG